MRIPIRTLGIAFALSVHLVVMGGVPAAAVVPRSSRSSPLISIERGCTEISYLRGGAASVIRPLVPRRFTLVPFTDDPDELRVQLYISEVSCDVVRTDGRRQRQVASIYVAAATETVDGKPSDGPYLLQFATENRRQARAFNALGWDTDLLSRGGVVSTNTMGGLRSAAITMGGSGWDHTTTAYSRTPAPAPFEATATYYRDVPGAQLKLCFQNFFSYTGSLYFGDMTTTPFADLAYVPPVYYGYPGNLVTGGWTSTLTSGSCPAPSASGVSNDQLRRHDAGGRIGLLAGE